ncbi:hypothetical protein ARMGADRAFT_1010768 [Armillaria gallica]|uniref:F-box domain-containing protein n=1 Tax=Armillaria gallica TaxID=47427 RepID=A0A2H3DP54_ARMGA|nr:hypothetical protein ARMGADRAFT_1010768 [Armillaria gallica]
MITPSKFHKFSQTYLHLTASNYSPLDCESEEIGHLLEEAQTTMEGLRHQLALDDDEMERLIIAWHDNDCSQATEEKYSALREVYNFIRHHRPVLAAVRRLPPEIISEIFLHTLSWDDWRFYHRVHNTRLGPWSYCRVSRLWRTVALSLSQLWSEFNFNEIDAAACCEPPVPTLKLWLDRSGDLPLRIYGEVGGDATVPRYEAMARLIVSQCHRWEIFIWEEAPYKRAPVATGDVRDTEAVEETAAPCQQELLPEEIWDGADAEHVLARPQLRQFHAGGTVKSNPFRLLQSAPNLTTLSLRLDIPSHFLPATPIVHTRLRLLDVAWCASKLIDHLTLTQLEKFGVTLSSVSKVAAFLRRSGSTLEELYIRDPVPLGGHLSPILNTVPRLKRLSLRWASNVVPGPGYANNHVSILDKLSVVKEGQPVLLPSLQSLSMEIDESFQPQCLLRMLELRSRLSRCGNNNCQLLKNVELKGKSEEVSLARVKSYISARKKHLGSQVQISFL